MKQFFKNFAISLWCLLLIVFIIYVIRFTVRDLGPLFSCQMPFVWCIIIAAISTILALILPQKKQ